MELKEKIHTIAIYEGWKKQGEYYRWYKEGHKLISEFFYHKDMNILHPIALKVERELGVLGGAEDKFILNQIEIRESMMCTKESLGLLNAVVNGILVINENKKA